MHVGIWAPVLLKQLHLIRHAKSSWDHPELSDHQRPLNDRGRHAAPLVGRAMHAEIEVSGREIPQFFVSTAQRARETFDGLTIGWPLLGEQFPNYDDALYTFDKADLIDWIAAANDGLDSIALIGHNPAMTELANFLCLRLALSNLPTAGWLWFGFDDDSWGASVQSPGRGRCHTLYTPKSGKLL
ncbi:MAG TPA: phosphoglycerate mutase [Halieaceae bacterium]|nr:phosphoglycerate mutase [Halieaceae bacterium]